MASSQKGSRKYYAVRSGHNPGVYRSWAECEEQVKGVSGAIHKSFATRAAAEAFVKGQEPRSVSRKAAGTGKTSVAAAGPAPKRRRSSTTTASGDEDEAFVLRFDGGARGNPGPSGSGALVLLPGGLQVVARTRRFLGTYSTNNEAEYDALITGLKLASKLRPPVRSLRVEGDSSLVINQMQDVWICAAPGLAPLHAEAQALARGFERVTYVHIRRELNSLADELANAAMDSRQDAEELLQDVHEAYLLAQEQEQVI